MKKVLKIFTALLLIAAIARVVFLMGDDESPIGETVDSVPLIDEIESRTECKRRILSGLGAGTDLDAVFTGASKYNNSRDKWTVEYDAEETGGVRRWYCVFTREGAVWEFEQAGRR